MEEDEIKSYKSVKSVPKCASACMALSKYVLCYVDLILTGETFSHRLLFKVPSNNSTSTYNKSEMIE